MYINIYMDNSEHNLLSAWPIISSVIGWCYFLAWSISFYPQVILNWQRKSVKGLSMDFLYYNVYGFFCYWVFNITFFFSKEIQKEYRERNDSKENLVRFNDVMFATHALFISFFTLIQTFYYKKENTQKISKIAKYFILVTSMGILGMVLIIIFFGDSIMMWIDLIYYLSYIKLTISLIKYIPQAWLNFKRKSTAGWSIYNILLDCTGGVLSMTQLIIDSSLKSDWNGILGNPVKLYV
ncbi:PQ loop repeat-domain-containing protein [Cokeromyces recurvatus]|uniref:PQ loop repeat-domain-containing protein n=1 Tax=Cokeromyces recurvatus TaxID=90255 RepID=UPI00222050E1|nr:PQ loop repeat-domain-containing protein [Cokeromyces recurvatus]KAI7905511.1 PQ loop repeat-domain-containing protein [Cokeromyces recurvatus]